MALEIFCLLQVLVLQTVSYAIVCYHIQYDPLLINPVKINIPKNKKVYILSLALNDFSDER